MSWPWWYLSFADESGWLGGCYVEAPIAKMAHLSALTQGCNPGGEVAILGPLLAEQMINVPAEFRNRLLTREEIDAQCGDHR